MMTCSLNVLLVFVDACHTLTCALVFVDACHTLTCALVFVDACHTLTCALMLLNTDLHTQVSEAGRWGNTPTGNPILRVGVGHRLKVLKVTATE